MAGHLPDIETVVTRIRGEYLEMPGLTIASRLP